MMIIFDSRLIYEDKGLPWNVQRFGCRVEYWFRRKPTHNGAEAAANAIMLARKYDHRYAAEKLERVIKTVKRFA